MAEAEQRFATRLNSFRSTAGGTPPAAREAVTALPIIEGLYYND